ncbi:hypothetical protein IWZ00DRAFT_493946 [Phyllosticta capitalensis]|uniref:Uncharacterized protein n=1 Tax=Phyllosticta capitalensis TaxID=121624 RepID=A0ABR1YNC1_9PEZI
MSSVGSFHDMPCPKTTQVLAPSLRDLRSLPPLLPSEPSSISHLNSAALGTIFLSKHISALHLPTITMSSRDDAIRDWALDFEQNILLQPQHLHLRPTTAAQELVDIETALAGRYEHKPILECATVFLRDLKSAYTRYPSERGERTVLKCFTSALTTRFAKGEGSGVPGLVLADVVAAEKLAREIMRRSGSVEPPTGEYLLSLPTSDLSWVSRLRMMEEDKPAWPTKDQFATTGQYDTAMGLAEQEWWEAWVNRKGDSDKRLILDYDGYNGGDFDRSGRNIDDYKGPMDWEVDFTYYLMILALTCVGDHDLGMRLMTGEVQERLQKGKGSKKAWLTLIDLKKIVAKRSRQLDKENKSE